VALLVGGLGSSSRSASIEELRTDDLGYGPDDVVRFSYAGGRTPDEGEAFTRIEPHHYDSRDTQGDLYASASLLADAIEAAAEERPGALIDVYAHSMGGVVTRLALLELEDRGVDLDRLGLVATLGSPHRGADLATALAAANEGLVGSAGADALAQGLDTGLDPDAESIAQLAETSAAIDEIERRGVPDGVEVVSLAARGDVVVTSPQTRVDDARNVTLGGGIGRGVHGALVGSDAATDELARALAGQPRHCESDFEMVTDTALGHGLSYAEDSLGGTLAGVGP
jgi:pimeloyl-ACP methyl ester carboxylesterase